ncbi:uncharacterized protein ATNIH1004_011720 [Aspergillus tanneri]|uniref:Uncharacterized protein n=1 Tax=Aspergillus tanneri TaxID=1220188 RepID=A0A5M9M8B2_9EURO|nr:uncharacterized protein ATNIH1004_011720 [Aspergillus tanneri]KAA8641584.1 hypothetical protein ATNIH1004_011720 [Aspergillus tanneri]
MWRDTSLDVHPRKSTLYYLCVNSCAFPSWRNYRVVLDGKPHVDSFLPDEDILEACDNPGKPKGESKTPRAQCRPLKVRSRQRQRAGTRVKFRMPNLSGHSVAARTIEIHTHMGQGISG